MTVQLPLLQTEEEEKDRFSAEDEYAKCAQSVIYFVFHYVWIESILDGDWIPFKLWSFQARFLKDLTEHLRFIVGKSRQMGFTWLILAYFLWRMVFFPVAAIGLFSKGDEEAKELLDRLKNMYGRLPEWIKADNIEVDNAHRFKLSNQSWARAFSTKGGESYSYSHVLMDEFDRFPNAQKLKKNVMPAAESANSQVIIGSIWDREESSESVFKNMFRSAWEGLGKYRPVFWRWSLHPKRDKKWREDIIDERMADHAGDEAGAWDEINTSYPGSVEEMMAPPMQNKRIPFSWLQKVYEKVDWLPKHDGPALPGLKIYKEPGVGHTYVIGADPAEGVPGGSDSSLRILDDKTGEEVCALEGKWEPMKVFPKIIFDLAIYYNYASVLVERNNHGLTVIAELENLIADKQVMISLLRDPSIKKTGWHTNARSKVEMFDTCAEFVKEEKGQIHDPVTLAQLADIDINKLAAMTGKDDAADAYALASLAIELPGVYIKGKGMH